MSTDPAAAGPNTTNGEENGPGFRFFDERRNPPPSGLVDRFIRRFRLTAHLTAMLCLYALGALILGIALAPALYFLDWALPTARRLGGVAGLIGQKFATAVQVDKLVEVSSE